MINDHNPSQGHLDGPPPSYDDVVAPKLYSSIEQGVIETRVNIDAPSNLNSGGAPPIVHCVNVQPQMYPQPPPQVLYRSFVPAQLPWPDGKCPKNIFCPNCNRVVTTKVAMIQSGFNGAMIFMLVLMIIIMILLLPIGILCCFFLFSNNNYKRAIHKCPSCNKQLAFSQR